MKIAHPEEKNLVPASHEDPANPGVFKKVLFGFADFNPTCGLKMLNYAVMKPGRSFAKHSHPNMEEVFYILHGLAEVKFESGPETTQLKAGEAVIVPFNTEHTMKNIGSDDLEYLAFGAAKE